EADGGIVGKAKDRLVVDDELVAVERGLELAYDAGVEGPAFRVARVPLGRVHLAVGPAEKLLGRGAVLRMDRPADRGVDFDGDSVHGQRRTERLAQATDQRCGLVLVLRAETHDADL